MVKSRAKAVQKKLKKLQKSEQGEGAAPAREGPAPPVRIQQKLTKKVRFLQKVAANKPQKLAVKAGVGKKKKKKAKPSTLADLSTLVEGLAGAHQESEARRAQEEQRRRPGQSVGTLKGRARVLEQETSRLHQVLHHPQFLADPLAAVKSHLSATLPQAPPAARPRAQGHIKLPRAEKKRRQKERRVAAAAMEDGD